MMPAASVILPEREAAEGKGTLQAVQQLKTVLAADHQHAYPGVYKSFFVHQIRLTYILAVCGMLYTFPSPAKTQFFSF